MANICTVKGYICIDDQENADKLYGGIEAELEKNNDELDFGGNSTFWDTSVEQEGCKILLNCCMNWNFDPQDMKKFVEWMLQFVPIEKLKCELKYEELGLDILGKYVLCEGLLEDYFVRWIEFPAYPEIGPDDDEEKIHQEHLDKLYKLAEAGESEIIHQFNKEDAQ